MLVIALRLAIDVGLLDAAVALSPAGSDINVEQLASRTGADRLLVK